MTIVPRPRRIAIDARSYLSSSGAYVRNLIAELQTLDTETLYDIYVPKEVVAAPPITSANVRWRACSARAYSLAEQLTFLGQLLWRKYDLVHFAMQQQPALYLRPHVTTFHDLTIVSYDTLNGSQLINKSFRMVASLLFRVTLRTSRVVIVPSHATKRAVVSFANLPDSKIVVTPEAADIVRGELAPYELPFSRYILYVGNFYEYKNVARLVQAHQRLREDDPNLGLVLVGRIHRAANALVSLIEESSLQNVVMTGFIDDAQRNYLYANCAAYVFPSLSEGFGLPGLEAMAFGAPVIAARATSLPEVYLDAAHYFDPYDVDDMVEQIKTVISSDEVKSAMRIRNASVLDAYSWRRMAEQTLAVYERAAPSGLFK